jgi:hypothetical protein
MLPASLCDELDKTNRGFVWGDTDTSRKIHTIPWNVISSPLQCGGLGVQQTRSMNQAFLMKVGWKLTTKKDALWVKVIRSKYNCGDDLIPTV